MISRTIRGTYCRNFLPTVGIYDDYYFVYRPKRLTLRYHIGLYIFMAIYNISANLDAGTTSWEPAHSGSTPALPIPRDFNRRSCIYKCLKILTVSRVQHFFYFVRLRDIKELHLENHFDYYF